MTIGPRNDNERAYRVLAKNDCVLLCVDDSRLENNTVTPTLDHVARNELVTWVVLLFAVVVIIYIVIAILDRIHREAVPLFI